MLAQVTFIAVYGLSLGMILFSISVGLAFTMGVMRVLNLAHGAFAAAGAYITVWLTSKWGISLVIAVPLATVVIAALSVPVERLFYRPIYHQGELAQVLLTIGIAFISIALLTNFFGPDPLPAVLPPGLSANIDVLSTQVQIYRIAVTAVGAMVVICLWLLLNHSLFGIQLRAAVDNNGMAQAVGVNVGRLYSMAFALGAGLAALGGAVGIGLMPPEPTYAFKYLVIILFVIGLAGEGKIMECAGVAIAIGLVDTAARYYVPVTGSYLIYVLAIILLLYRSRGTFRAT
jgi:branched-chain amino acid transport system permease protein